MTYELREILCDSVDFRGSNSCAIKFNVKTVKLAFI